MVAAKSAHRKYFLEQLDIVSINLEKKVELFLTRASLSVIVETVVRIKFLSSLRLVVTPQMFGIYSCILHVRHQIFFLPYRQTCFAVLSLTPLQLRSGFFGLRKILVTL